MNFIANNILSNSSNKAKEVMEKLQGAVTESEALDVMDELNHYLKTDDQGKKHIGALMSQLFNAIDKHNEQDEVRQQLLEVIHSIITVEDNQNSTTSRAPGLGGHGTATFEWLEVPMKNAVSVIENKEWVGSLLRLLHEKSHWTRLSTLKILISMLEVKPKETQEAIVHSQAGMQFILDLLDDLDDRYKVEAFLLLEKLSESSDVFRMYIFVYGDGFKKFFQIINHIDTYEAVIRDCLRVINNAVSSSKKLQDHFLECGGHFEIPRVLQRLLGRRGSLQGLDDDTHEEVYEPLKHIDLECVLEVLQLISQLVTGRVSDEIADEYGGAPFPGERKRLKLSPDPALDSQLKQSRLNRMHETQERLGRVDGLLFCVSVVALALRPRLEEVDLGTIQVRSTALKVLGDLIFDHEKNRQRLMQFEVLAVSGSLFADCDVRFVLDPDEFIGEQELQRFSMPDGIMRVALFAYEVDDLNAGNYCLACLMHNSPLVAQTIIGHAKYRPPQQDAHSPPVELVESPTAGRILIDTFLSMPDLILKLREGGAFVETDRLEIIKYTMWKSARIFEQLLVMEPACRTLSIDVTLSSSVRELSQGPSGGEQGNQETQQPTEVLEEERIFPFFVSQLRRVSASHDALLANRTADVKDELGSLVYPTLVSMLRVFCAWVNQSEPASKQIITSPSACQFLFSLLATNTNEPPQTGANMSVFIQGLCCLGMGLCMDGVGGALQKEFLDSIIRMVTLQRFDVLISTVKRTSDFRLAKRSRKALQRDGVAVKAYYSDIRLFDKDFVHFYDDAYNRVQQAMVRVFTGATEAAPAGTTPGGAAPNQIGDGELEHQLRQVDQLKQMIRILETENQDKQKEIDALEAVVASGDHRQAQDTVPGTHSANAPPATPNPETQKADPDNNHILQENLAKQVALEAEVATLTQSLDTVKRENRSMMNKTRELEMLLENSAGAGDGSLESEEGAPGVGALQLENLKLREMLSQSEEEAEALRVQVGEQKVSLALVASSSGEDLSIKVQDLESRLRQATNAKTQVEQLLTQLLLQSTKREMHIQGLCDLIRDIGGHDKLRIAEQLISDLN